MAINPLYVPLFTIEECILDKDTGLPLSGGVVTFYEDDQRTTPKDVFQISGSSPDYTFVDVGNTFVLGINGSFVDGSGDPFVPYAYPYDSDGEIQLYYVTVESEGAVAQFIREAVPYLGSDVIPPNQLSNTDNILSNPQFVEVNFPSTGSTVVSVTGTNTVTKVAPDWDIISTGTGTLTLQLLQPIASGVDTNPPYALSIAASSGLGSTITLRQRLYNSPSLLRTDYASGLLAAAVLSGGSSSISMVYAPSTLASTTIIPNTAIPTDGAYHIIDGNAQITNQANSPADTGYVDINILIPTSRTIAISSIQLVGAAYSVDIPFIPISSQRQKDQLFHYYENSILREPKKNLLTGWVFAQNPYQFKTKTISDVVDLAGVVAKCAYTIDQTIICQQAASNNVQTGQSVRDSSGGYEITPTNGSGAGASQFAMIQYIDPKTILGYWGQVVSALVQARLFSTVSPATTLKFKVRLIWRTSLPSVIGAAEPIASWAYGDTPVFSAGWTAIAPVNDPEYVLPNSYASTGAQDYPSFNFDQMGLPAASNSTAMTLGIVIFTTSSMNPTLGDKDSVVFKSVSLVPNEFAIEASPDTFDEGLAKCRFYYEKSYNESVLPGTNSAFGNVYAPLHAFSDGAGNLTTYAMPFMIQFNNEKRTNPAVYIYSQTGTINTVLGQLYSNGISRGAGTIAISNWGTVLNGQNRITFIPNNGTSFLLFGDGGSTVNIFGNALFHYVADSRLGLI